jgi:hypothetical protein
LCYDLDPPNYLKLFTNVFTRVCNIFFIFQMFLNDTPPSSLMDSTTSLKVKTTERGVRVRYLVRNTSGVEGCVGALGCGLGILTRKSITHTDLHKPNNKLVSA